jgi:hypothetical protein
MLQLCAWPWRLASSEGPADRGRHSRCCRGNRRPAVGFAINLFPITSPSRKFIPEKVAFQYALHSDFPIRRIMFAQAFCGARLRLAANAKNNLGSMIPSENRFTLFGIML